MDRIKISIHLVMLFFGVSVSFHGMAFNCHPRINSYQPQHIVGYGSLLLEESKARTLHHFEKNTPVVVKGYERGWFMRGYLKSQPTTFLGVKPRAGYHFNGVVFTVKDMSEMRYLDKREVGYCRQRVEFNAIKKLLNKPLPQGQYWIYIPQKSFMENATQRYPVSDYYLNVFLAGCLQVEKKYHIKHYARQCIKTTTSWSRYHQKKVPHGLKGYNFDIHEVKVFKNTFL